MSLARRARRAALLAAVGALVVGCGSAGPGPQADRTPAAVAGDLTVLAAASLTDAFTELADAFEAQHPGVRVSLGFGGSSALAHQVLAGAPADVLATASRETMDSLVGGGLVASEPAVFARNRLALAVPAGNPGGVEGLGDLARPDLLVALCAPQVPCGAAAERVLEEAGVPALPDTYERDVRAALVKVRLGEVDAALVYRTDVLAAGDAVKGIALPEAAGAATDYVVAALVDAPNGAAAAAFAAYVVSEPAQEVLARAGFDLP